MESDFSPSLPASLTSKLALFEDTLPLTHAATIPPLWYQDEELYRRELETVFSRHWIWAGKIADLQQPGSYLTLNVGNEPVIVARTKDGKLVALSNVCRHRGTQIITAAHGKASSLQCRYHGWTYDLEGNLKATPQFEGVEHFSKQDNCLPRFEADTWGPFVFVRLEKSGPTLHVFLKPLIDSTEGLGLEKLQFVRRTEYEIQCNWKVFVDNYLDGGYHVKTLHRGLAGVLDDSQYTNHLFEMASLQTSPLQKDTSGVSQVRRGDRAYYWWVFPNLMINIYEGVMDINVVEPLGTGKCRVLFEYFFADTHTDAQKAFIDQSIKVAHQVQLEDQEICESVQKGLASLHYKAGRFSVKREGPGYHFHQRLAHTLKSSLT